MLVELKGWGDITGDSVKAVRKLHRPHPKHGGPGVVQNGGTTNVITCKDFDFNFTNAHITGNVVINIPHVGEIFCGEKGVTTDHSSKTVTTTSSSKDSTKVKTYDATRNATGGWNLELVHVTEAVGREYRYWSGLDDKKKYLRAHKVPQRIILLI